MENTLTIDTLRANKNVIIGKAWKPNPETGRQGSIKISRDLPIDLVLKAGTSLNVNFNNQREGKQDADYNISVIVPTTQADELIETMKASASKRTAENADQE